MSTTHRHSPFRVGDRVKIAFGRDKVTGVIVETLGPLGAQGRHLYRAEVPMDPFEPMTLELSEEEIEAAGPEEPVQIEKERVIEYLTHGGLLSILQANMGGRNHPRAWLCLDHLGNVTHTFTPERGVLGGQPVPYSAIWEGKISARKRDAVVSFVESFGLNRHEAERVVSDLGTAP